MLKISGKFVGKVSDNYEVFHYNYDYLVERNDKGEAVSVFAITQLNIDWINQGLVLNGYNPTDLSKC